jgi:hypothetical protein
MAAAIREDSFLIDPAWLLEHPEFYQQIKVFDDRLTEMERRGSNEQEYQAILALMVRCVQEAKTLQGREQASMPVGQ